MCEAQAPIAIVLTSNFHGTHRNKGGSGHFPFSDDKQYTFSVFSSIWQQGLIVHPQNNLVNTSNTKTSGSLILAALATPTIPDFSSELRLGCIPLESMPLNCYTSSLLLLSSTAKSDLAPNAHDCHKGFPYNI